MVYDDSSLMNETALKLKFEITTSMEYFSIEPYVI